MVNRARAATAVAFSSFYVQDMLPPAPPSPDYTIIEFATNDGIVFPAEGAHGLPRRRAAYEMMPNSAGVGPLPSMERLLRRLRALHPRTRPIIL